MKVLIVGGSGLIGKALAESLIADSHDVWVLTRHPESAKLLPGVQAVGWDGKSSDGWGYLANEVDAIVNLAGESLSKWPWTKQRKQLFYRSRIEPGQAVVAAVRAAVRPPKVLVQSSGINYYGLSGTPADESTSPGIDFLSNLALAWEASTEGVEKFGVRRVIIRTAVVFAKNALLYDLMALPVRLFVGGKLGDGKQAVPWIHIDDQVGAIRFLLENDQTDGAFNLVAPDVQSNAAFYQTMAKVMKRPYWFPVPAFAMNLVLGEMSVLVLEGRFSRPTKLLEMGYKFKFPELEGAIQDLVSK